MNKTVFGILLASTAGITPLWAQDAPFETNAVYLGTLTLQSGEPDEVAITSDDLERNNPSDLADVFKSEPTISVGSSIPASQKIYVNGVEEVNLLVTIDGGRQNNRIFHHSATTIIDPDMLKAVRVDPGVAPADAGPGALAGSIAWETKDAADLLDPDDNFGGSVNLEWDSNGSSWSRSAMLYGRTGGFEALGFLKFAEGDNREDGDGDEIPGSGTGLVSGLAKLAWESQDGERLEFSYEKVTDDDQRPYRANIGAIIGGRIVALTREYDIERENYVLSYTDQNPSGWLDPTIRLAYNDTELEIPEDDQNSYGRTTSLNALIQNRFAVGTGDVTVGFDFYHDETELDYVYDADSAWNTQAEEVLENYGAFAQGRFVLADRLNLSVGGRFDLQDFEGVDGSTQSESGFSGNVSVSYDVTDQITLSAGYSDKWGGIQIAENFVMNEAWDYSDDGIAPTTAQNLFVSAEAYFGAFSFDAKYFETQIQNARVDSYSIPDDTADMTSSGFELGGSYTWGSGFARLAYADIDTTVNGETADSYSGTYLTVPLGKEVVLQAMHSFDALGVRVGGDLQWVLENSEAYDLETGDADLTLPEYTVVNIWADYRPKGMDNFVIRGEVNNLFDETYAARATYGQDFESVEPLYEPGRSFVISATYKF